MEKVKIGKGKYMDEYKVKKIRNEPGGSNIGEYPNTKHFAGSKPGTYPIDTIKEGKSALKLAHNDSCPACVKEKVYKRFPSLKPSKK